MLNVQGIRKTFNPGTANEVRALQGVDLTIADGEFVVVIGSNGSGKSTLLNAVAGAFFVDAGRISLDGEDITPKEDYHRAGLIGRVFQDPFRGTAPEMSIAENFALASRRGRRRGLGWALKKDLLRQIAEQVKRLHLGLEDRLHNLMGSLSGGQRQSLTLLMAAWLQPKLLLLDEHTAALDPKSADLVIKLTEEIIRREGLTTLMVTHSMQQAVNLGDRLIMMDRGCIVHDLKGGEKMRLRPNDLLARFDEIRREALLDETAAEIIRRLYV